MNQYNEPRWFDRLRPYSGQRKRTKVLNAAMLAELKVKAQTELSKRPLGGCCGPKRRRGSAERPLVGKHVYTYACTRADVPVPICFSVQTLRNFAIFLMYRSTVRFEKITRAPHRPSALRSPLALGVGRPVRRGLGSQSFSMLEWRLHGGATPAALERFHVCRTQSNCVVTNEF